MWTHPKNHILCIDIHGIIFVLQNNFLSWQTFICNLEVLPKG